MKTKLLLGQMSCATACIIVCLCMRACVHAASMQCIQMLDTDNEVESS